MQMLEKLIEKSRVKRLYSGVMSALHVSRAMEHSSEQQSLTPGPIYRVPRLCSSLGFTGRGTALTVPFVSPKLYTSAGL